MIINKGSKIEVIFRNSMQVSGIVEEWGDRGVLFSIKTNSYIIIQDIRADVMAIIVHKTENLEIKEPKKIVAPEPVKNNESKIDKLPKDISNTDNFEHNLKIKKLAELKILQAKQEKEIIANKLKNHEIKEIKQVQYGLPSFMKR